MPLITLFDKQIPLRMGQANVRRWVDDILPLLTDEDPLGVDSFATHRMKLDDASWPTPCSSRRRTGPARSSSRPDLLTPVPRALAFGP